jgi:hypothetical protein
MSDRLYATLLQVEAVMAQDKAKMPDLTASIRKAGSAAEVAELINSAWLTYGAGAVEGTSFPLENDLEEFDGAMKYLWFKSKDSGNSRTYTMRGIPYQVQAVDSDGTIAVTVSEVA